MSKGDKGQPLAPGDMGGRESKKWVIGEGGESGEFVVERSVVFATMEVHLQLLFVGLVGCVCVSLGCLCI